MTCDEHLTAMVPYLRGELEPLRRAHIESHLGHCGACAAVRDQLAAGLEAARGWRPELTPDEIERRVVRLGPYLEPRGGRVSLVAGLAGAALLGALVVTIAVLARSHRPTPRMEEATTVFDFSDNVAFDLIPGEPALTHHQPAPYLRLIAPRTWDGALVRRGRRTTIDMSRGFVAVAFTGGHGRRLRVRTPAATVDVVGTRFVVDIGANGVTTVAVSEGRVRVRAGGRTLAVGADQVRAVGAGGEPIAAKAPPSIRLLEDHYLVRHAPRPRPQPPATGPPPHPPAVAIRDVLAQLARAEELANDDQVAAAVTIFESCADDASSSYDPYRDLCRLQLARLWGFRQNEPARAHALLERLARGRGQVAREAALARCELALERDPCAARACLEQIAVDSDARHEVTGLMARWRLEERTCP